jgi:integrase
VPDVPPKERRRRIVYEALGRLLAEHLAHPGTPLIPEDVAGLLPAARVQQVEAAVAGLQGEGVAPAERTVQAHVEAWRQSQQTRVNGGQLSAVRLNNALICLRHFETFVGAGADVVAVNERALEGFYTCCLKRAGEDWSVPYAKEAFSVTRGFVRWLWRQGAIEQLPRNIDSRDWRFDSTAKKVEVWTAAEFKLAVREAPGNFKLILLLMMNCGMRQKSVSDLLDSQVNWKAGRITLKRGKTRRFRSVPTVSYLLWPTTFELLKQYRSGQERVLLTESGQAYVRSTSREDSRARRADGITSRWAHLKKRLRKKRPGFSRTLKGIRATASTLLEGHETYGRFTQLFLGHAPRSIAEKHYVVPSQDLFDEAVRWLGEQLGLA